MKICKNCNCLKKIKAKNLCNRCYLLILRYGTNEPAHWNKKCIDCDLKFVNMNGKTIRCNKCRKIKEVMDARISYRKKHQIPLHQPKYKDRKHKDKNGYILIYKKDHPNSCKSGNIKEHSYVMSEFLGRPLKKGENVHHKNGIRDDNRIENLELWSTAQPPGQRIEDKIEWAKEFLHEYGYKVI